MTIGIEFEFRAVAIDHKLLNRPHDVRIADGLAFVGGKGGSFGIVSTDDMTVQGGLTGFTDVQVVRPVTSDCCYFGDANGVHVADVGDPTDPGVKSSLEHESLRVFNGWDRWGPFLIGASKRGFLGAINGEDPFAPEFAGGIETRGSPGLRAPHDLGVVDDHAIVPDQHQHAGEMKVGIYRLEQSGNEVAFEPVAYREDFRLQGANRVIVRDGVAYVAASSYSKSVGVFEGIPTDPKLRSILKAKAGVTGLALSENHLFVGAGATVEAYDVSTPQCPAIAGSIEDQQHLRGPGSVHDMEVVGEDLFVTAQRSDRLVKYHLNSE